MLTEGELRVTGVAQNISESGALVTNVSEVPPVTTVGRLRLLALRTSLQTPGADSLDLPVIVTRHDPRGFAIEFLQCREKVSALLNRALSRGALERTESAGRVGRR